MSTYLVNCEGRNYSIEVTGEGTVLIDGREVHYEFLRMGGGSHLLRIDGSSHDIFLPPGAALSRADIPCTLSVDGQSVETRIQDEHHLLARKFGATGSETQQQRHIRAPMPGLVTRILVKPGDTVEAGTGVLVLEAMKMENELKAPAAGVIRAVLVSERDSVEKNAILLELQ